MHFLRTAVQSLHVRGNELCPRSEHLQMVEESELLGYAIDLCKCVPFFIEPSCSTVGGICCFFPLSLAARYFKQFQHWDLFAWVGNVRQRIFNIGVSMPVIEGAEMPKFAMSRWRSGDGSNIG